MNALTNTGFHTALIQSVPFSCLIFVIIVKKLILLHVNDAGTLIHVWGDLLNARNIRMDNSKNINLSVPYDVQFVDFVLLWLYNQLFLWYVDQLMWYVDVWISVAPEAGIKGRDK